jgi:hypothetical protein
MLMSLGKAFLETRGTPNRNSTLLLETKTACRCNSNFEKSRNDFFFPLLGQRTTNHWGTHAHLNTHDQTLSWIFPPSTSRNTISARCFLSDFFFLWNYWLRATASEHSSLSLSPSLNLVYPFLFIGNLRIFPRQEK